MYDDKQGQGHATTIIGNFGQSTVFSWKNNITAGVLYPY